MAYDVTQHVTISIENKVGESEIIVQNVALYRYVCYELYKSL